MDDACASMAVRQSFAEYLLAGVLPLLDHMHSRKVVHRDIKAANIMFSGGKMFLVDLGMAAPSHNSGHDGVCQTGGTVDHMPLEVLANPNCEVDAARDW